MEDSIEKTENMDNWEKLESCAMVNKFTCIAMTIVNQTTQLSLVSIKRAQYLWLAAAITCELVSIRHAFSRAESQLSPPSTLSI